MTTHSFYFKTAFFTLAFVFIGFIQTSIAQTTSNPFELTPRVPAKSEKINEDKTEQAVENTNPFELDRVISTSDSAELSSETPTPDREEEIITTTTEDSNNPFEIITSPTKEVPILEESLPKQNIDVATPELVRPTINPRLLNGVIFFILVLLAVLASLFRSALSKSVQAFFNDNLLGQIYREQSSGVTIPYLAFYILFLLNAGIFTFLILHYFKVSLLPQQFSGILGTILVVSGVLLLKLLVLWLIGKIYPIEKETKLYRFTVIIFSIICGLILIPANILLAYASDEVVRYTIYGVAIGLGLVYLLRALRGIIIANRFLLFHKFHFLLYICTIEIAPVIILLKFI